MLNEERCLLNYKISFEWILYPKSQSIPHLISSRSVPLIATNNGRRRRLLSSITVAQYPRIHPLRLLLFTGSVLLLLLHFCPRVCWSPFSIWPSRRSLKGRPLDRHSNHSTSPIVGLLRSFSLSLGYCIHLLRVLLCSGLHCPSLIRSPQFTAFIHLSYFNCCLFSVFLLAYYYERPSMCTRGRKGDPSSSLWDYVV